MAGVVGNFRQSSLTDEFYPEVFIDYRHLLALFTTFLSFAVLVRDNPAAALEPIRRAVRDVDSNIGVDALAPLVAARRRLADNRRARTRDRTQGVMTVRVIQMMLSQLTGFSEPSNSFA